jgi:hypothetical protein
MTQPAQPPSGERRDVFMMGPDPQTGKLAAHQGVIEWNPVSGGGLQLWAHGPFGDLGYAADDVFGALFLLRQDLHEKRWTIMVKGARRDAWRGSAQYPCDVHEVLLHPRFGAPPTQRVAALAQELDGTVLATWHEHLMYHNEWAGIPSPGGMTWTEYDQQRRQALAQRGITY